MPRAKKFDDHWIKSSSYLKKISYTDFHQLMLTSNINQAYLFLDLPFLQSILNDDNRKQKHYKRETFYGKPKHQYNNITTNHNIT